LSKHIFVTGGVVSSLGKGLTSAAIGTLLEARGLRVAIQKFDPYLNVDPGTMSPLQHGEVYVTDDGAETDLDLGHYERFTTSPLTRDSNFTAGQVYYTVISREREGKYLGRTIQVVPHITDEIKSCVDRLVADDVDVVITEIGGTVGDIEGLPFIEAIRQYGYDHPRGDVLYIHLTLVPYLRASGEIKSKPTQHSVQQLRELGIMPDILISRTELPLDRAIRDKISLFCNVEPRAVIEEIDLKENLSIYDLPVVLQKEGLDGLIVDKLGLPPAESDLSAWTAMLGALHHPEQEVEIAVVGKYLHLKSSYESIWEALVHAGIAHRAEVHIRPVESEDIEKDGASAHLDGVDGILVPGGFGMRGSEGKIDAVRYARENKVPYFGICLGMQAALIEFARNVVGLAGANSTEFDPETPHPVVDVMAAQKERRGMGGTMRLGAQPCVLPADTLAREAYGTELIHERHRHRYEFNSAYRERFRPYGLRIGGVSPDGQLVEIFELQDHPWFVSVQFHPEFKSKPTAAHPLFVAFAAAALRRREREGRTVSSAAAGPRSEEGNA